MHFPAFAVAFFAVACFGAAFGPPFIFAFVVFGALGAAFARDVFRANFFAIRLSYSV